MIRILISAYSCDPNKGSEPGVGWNWPVYLARYCEVTVLTRGSNKHSIQEALNKQRIDNISFLYFDIPMINRLSNYIPFYKYIYYYIWQVFSIFYLKRNQKYHQYDIYHHLTFNTFQVPAKLYKLGGKSIWGPVGGGMVAPHHLFFKIGFMAGLKELYRSMMVNLGKIRFGVREALNRYDYVLFANSDTQQFLNRYTKKSSLLLETGIKEGEISDLNILKSNKHHSVKLLFVGSLIPRKGIMLLLDALKELESISFTLSVVGSGPLENKLKRFVRNHLCSNNIKFFGEISHEKLQTIYQTHDILIFPSLRDTSGNVLLEAMSNGLAVIAFDHHGSKDILDSHCGIKIAISSYEEMKKKLNDAIIKLSLDPGLRLQLGINAVQRIREMYTWENKSKMIYHLYHNVISGK